MRSLLILILFMVFINIETIPEPKNNSIEKITVNEFIDQLETNKYRQSKGLPDFQPRHIADLLKIASKDTIINNFPRNPLSSYFQMEESLRAVSLWLIEGIRINYGKDSINLITWFPSLNPVLVNKKADIPEYENSESNLKEAYEAYIKWWSSLKNKDTSDIMNSNPLEPTTLRWH